MYRNGYVMQDSDFRCQFDVTGWEFVFFLRHGFRVGLSHCDIELFRSEYRSHPVNYFLLEAHGVYYMVVCVDTFVCIW